jgi:type IV pilus assembly protein PilO
VPKLSLAGLPWKVQLAIFLGLSIAAAGAFYYFVEMPAQEAMATRQRELDGIRATINKGLSTARQLPEFKKEVSEMEAQLSSLKPILPEEKDAADLLRNVNTLAVQSNLTIRGFRPQPITTRTLHAEWPIVLELEGSYHNLGRFLDAVSKFPRIINVGNMSIRGARQQAASSSTIEVTCTATTFVLVEAVAATSAPAAKSAKKSKKTP